MELKYNDQYEKMLGYLPLIQSTPPPKTRLTELKDIMVCYDNSVGMCLVTNHAVINGV